MQHGTCVSTELDIGQNDSYSRASDFSQDGNIVSSLNLICEFVNMKSSFNHSDDNYMFLCFKIHQGGSVL
jgi:hypothetical protein